MWCVLIRTLPVIQLQHHLHTINCFNRKFPSVISWPQSRLPVAFPQCQPLFRHKLSEKVRFHGKKRALLSLKSCCHRIVAVVPLPKDESKRRKRRRTHGNKGKVPWNKGIKHSAETRALIKKNTREALRDPKVRKKMASHARPHSEEIKAKISTAMKKKWEIRLSRVKMRERFHLSWSLAIAEAAKNGGIEQSELKWDSNKKKTKKKEIIVKRVTKPKLADKVRGRVKKKLSATKRKKEERTPENLSLKQKLTKIRSTKATESRANKNVTSLGAANSSWSKLDIELKNVVNGGGESSLAEQIKAAKSKRSMPLVTLE